MSGARARAAGGGWRSTVRAVARLVPLGLGALPLLAGCAMVEKPEVTELLWPAPPLTSRIKFVGVLRERGDLGKTSGELVADALLGPKGMPDSLHQPVAVATSTKGDRLYVSDYSRSDVLVFDFATRRSWFLGAPPHEFKRPFGIAVDERDNVYVVDSVQRLVRVFDASGKFLRNILDERMERPTGIAIDPVRRRMYVADSSRRASTNHVIHVFDGAGAYLKPIGGRGDGEAKFNFPTYLAVDGDGRLYVTDTLNARVQVFDAEGRYLTTFGERGDTFGKFDKPKGVALDSFGNVYVVDSSWNNVQIFNGKRQVLLYFAGHGRIPGLLFNPTGIAIDRENRIYVADTYNSRVAIYQLINTRAEDSFLVPPAPPDKGGDAAARTPETPAAAVPAPPRTNASR